MHTERLTQMRPPTRSTTYGAPDRYASPPTPADIAASALETAAMALRTYSATIRVLEARITRLEADAGTTKAQHCTAKPIPPFPVVEAVVDLESRSHVDTATAARWLNRRPQTLRTWACYENGPLRPSRLNGRLKWSVADIRAALVATQA